ncbi:MAG: Recombinase, phage RecT family [Oscillospiraceae bacterium]|jgi:hypothetical protein
MSNAKEMTAAVQAKDITLGTNIFSGFQEFQVAQRMAQALASSTIVPKDYQGNIGNCIIALEMANRLNTSPMMVMQNLYIVNGRPAWSSQYIVGMINASRKYKTELQYHLEGTGMNMSCYAYAEDHNGHIVKGPVITMQMAKDEGWLDKNGSKWKTMPEVMLRYRAASFFGRLNCPDMIMGIYSADEVVELGPDAYREIDPAEKVQQEIQEKANQEPVDIHVDQDTGEVKEQAQKVQKEANVSAQETPKQASKKQKPQKPEPAEKSSDAGYDPGF